MIASTRAWFRRNRTNFAIGAGAIGAGYVVSQYVLGKITETRQRMSDDRIAKEKYIHPPPPQLSRYSIANTAVQQFKTSLRTKPGRLHLHSPRNPPYRNREHLRSSTCRTDIIRTTAPARGEVGEELSYIRSLDSRSCVHSWEHR